MHSHYSLLLTAITRLGFLAFAFYPLAVPASLWGIGLGGGGAKALGGWQGCERKRQQPGCAVPAEGLELCPQPWPRLLGCVLGSHWGCEASLGCQVIPPAPSLQLGLHGGARDRETREAAVVSEGPRPRRDGSMSPLVGSPHCPDLGPAPETLGGGTG